MPQSVLICDDELHVTAPLAIKFRKAGYEVKTAADGEAAWEAIQQQCPDLLITDILMPELDGYGLVQRIREHDSTRALPIVFLTATAVDSKPSEVAETFGVIKVVPKPYSVNEMLTLTEQLIGEASSAG